MRAAAWLFGQPGHGRPVQPRRAYGVGIDVVGADLEVRCLGATVEVQREVIGWKNLAEGNGRRVLVVGHHVAVVNAEAGQFVADELAERVGAHTRDQGRAVTEACRGHRHVGGAAAEELAESLDILQAHPDLQGINVDAAAPDGEYVMWLCSRQGSALHE